MNRTGKRWWSDAECARPRAQQLTLLPGACDTRMAAPEHGRIPRHSLTGLAVLRCALLVVIAFMAISVQAADLYKNDFEKSEVGKLPEDLMVLEGAFSVKEENGNKFMELPGTPLETFGVLFGPNETDSLAVTARVYGTSRGRRAPSFGVGLNGVGGFRLQMAPGKRAIELYKGEELLTNAPVKWQSGSWTFLRLAVTKAGGEWKIAGKAWKEGEKEPSTPIISHVVKEEPISGKASVWGAPYADTPIRFDDLRVAKAGGPS